MRHQAMQRAAVPAIVPLLNPVVASLLRIGLPMGPMILLTVRGRRTGLARTTPVGLFANDGRQYLFSTFGEVEWVRNVRVAGEVVLSRGRRRETFAAAELAPEDAAPVLRDAIAPYLATPGAFVLRRHFDVPAKPSLADFTREARRHPVFALRKEGPANNRGKVRNP